MKRIGQKILTIIMSLCMLLITTNPISALTYDEHGIPKTYKIDDAFSLPTNVKNGDLTFAGWHEREDLTDDSLFYHNAGNYGEKTYYAEWGYNIDYHLNGGSFLGELKPLNENDVILIDNKEFTFVKNSNTNTQILSGKPGDSTEVVEFEIDLSKVDFSLPCTIENVSGRKAAKNYSKYNPNNLPFVLPTPIRSSKINTNSITVYNFLGWYDNAELSGTPIIEIPIGTTGNKEYWAKWDFMDKSLNTADNKKDYFYIEAVENGNIMFCNDGISATNLPIIEYSINDKNNFQPYTIGQNISLLVGQKVYFRGDNNSFSNDEGNIYIKSTNKINAGGNIMSLLDKSCESTVLTNDYTFEILFDYCLGLQSIENLKLPATTLSEYCYNSMFSNCTGLTSIPGNLLPATNLAQGCYEFMFAGCTSLTFVPEGLLPATNLAIECYFAMFNSCSSLKFIPSDLLPATNLTKECYAYMFSDCTSLKLSETQTTDYQTPFRIPTDGTGVSSFSNSLSEMFSNTGGTFQGTPEINKTYYLWGNDFTSDYFYIEAVEDGNVNFTQVGTLTTPPVLEYSINDKNNFQPYTIGQNISLLVGQKVYFRGDNSTFNRDTYNNYLKITSTNKINTGGNIMSLLDKTCELLDLTDKSNVFNHLFYNNDKLISANDLKLPATTSADFCYGYMFYGCTSLTEIPELPATKLAYACYAFMFKGCTSIKLSETKIDGYKIPYRIPTEGIRTVKNYSSIEMFTNTGGTFTGTPEINKTYYLWDSTWEDSNDYFYLEAVEDGNVNFTQVGTLTTPPVLEYSINDKNNFQPYTIGQNISLLVGQKVYFRGDNNSFSNDEGNIYIKSTNKINAGGNIMSLLDKSCESTVLTNDYVFCRLFYQCIGLQSINNLRLSALKLSQHCYEEMFAGCDEIKAVPFDFLPAMDLSSYCYNAMFENCTSLKTLPDLPAYELPNYCYRRMFANCSSIKLSSVNTESNKVFFTIPSSFISPSEEVGVCEDMFINTGGTFKGTPILENFYYLEGEMVKEYNITYHNVHNLGEYDIVVEKYNIDDLPHTLITPPVIPDEVFDDYRMEYHFMGWTDDPDATTVYFGGIKSIIDTFGSKHYYAIWQSYEYVEDDPFAFDDDIFD